MPRTRPHVPGGAFTASTGGSGLERSSSVAGCTEGIKVLSFASFSIPGPNDNGYLREHSRWAPRCQILRTEDHAPIAATLFAHPGDDALLVFARLDQRPEIVLGAALGELEQDVR